MTTAMLNNRFRAVLFDLDGTLVFHEPDSFDLISAFCADIGQPLDAEAERLGRRTRHEYFVDPIIRSQLSDLSRDGFWQHFNRHLLAAIGIRGNLDQLAAKVTACSTKVEMVYCCPEPGCQTLIELRVRGYRLGLITNRQHVDRFHELLDQLALRSHFEMILASGDVGVLKPEPGIFFAALGQMGVQAEQAIYVGDNYWADVVGARRAGVTPVLFDPHRLFPEADCLIVEHIEDLLAWLP